MKRMIGFGLIILAIPLLVAVQGEIAFELNHSHALQDQLADSIELTHPNERLPVIMKDRDGLIFSEQYIEWRAPLSLSEIPAFVRYLFLDSEDSGFYEHRGYDVAAIARAFLANTTTDGLSQGGSTITQQLVRMRFLSTEKTYERKLTELFYAAELEKQNDKDTIFEMYLNDMYFGNKVYGIGGAATYYFNRPLAELNEAEMAFIAAIPNNPSLYNPLVHFDETKKRQERLLDLLARNNRITQEQATTFKQMPIQLSIKKKENHSPAYSAYILTEFDRLIAVSEGFAERLRHAQHSEEQNQIVTELKNRTDELLARGVVIETAYHPAKQQRDEQSMTALLRPHDLQAGAVVIDNATREIISVYGGRDYKTADFNRAYQAVRQPGSAMKPLLVYAPLFESGRYTENMSVDSSALCIGTYCPKNFGGIEYGNTTVKEAFRHSHNTAAVRLLRLVGIEEAFSFLEPFQFRSISSRDMNYSAALGGFSKGVTPLELADAYTSFIDGSYLPAHAIRAVKDNEGNILYQWKNERAEVWSPSTVETIRHLLEDVVLHGTGRGVTYRTSYTGAKTGTTDQYKDLWMAGMTDTYTTAVWIGYDMPRSMQQLRNQQIHLRAFSALLK